MRLFIIDEEQGSERLWKEQEERITVTCPRIVRHAQVVRLQIDEECAIQIGGVRYRGTVEEIGRKQLVIRVHSEISKVGEISKASVMMAIALPNTGAKLAMIVEKLTEVGVDQIVFFPAARSQMRALNNKKLEKISIRALEASEQSNRWTVPEVAYVRSLDEVLAMEGEKMLFEKGHERKCKDVQGNKKIIGLVGPEGGRTDEEIMKMDDMTGISLGETILRMETAAIVGGYELVQAACSCSD